MKIELRKNNIKCPYCGHTKNNIGIFEMGDNGYLTKSKDIVTCNSEEGGCDKDFCVKLLVRFHHETFSMTPKLDTELQSGTLNTVVEES